MRSRLLVSALLVALPLLGACGGSGADDPASSTPAGSDGGDKNASSGESDTGDGGGSGAPVTIVDSGFGQSPYTTQAMVVVTNDSDAVLGEFVTVSVNFLDAKGQILATEEQVESFNWVGQEIAMPVTPIDLDGKTKVATIEPSVSMSEYDMPSEAQAPLPVLDSTEIKKGDYGAGYTASFAFTNETDTDLKNLRVGVVCFDASQKIIGGTSTYPELAPAGKTIRIDADPTVTGKPASCKAYLNYDVA